MQCNAPALTWPPAGLVKVVITERWSTYVGNLHKFIYTRMAVVIDNHLPRRPLILSYVPDWPLPPRAYIPSESEMALQHVWRTLVVWRSIHLQYYDALWRLWLDRMTFQMFFVQSSPPLRTLLWEVSYVCQSVWRWKWFFCLSSCMLQRLWLCRTTDTVFRREISSRRQWGYGTWYGDSFPRCVGV